MRERILHDGYAQPEELTPAQEEGIISIKRYIDQEFPDGLMDEQGNVWKADQLECVLAGPVVTVAPRGYFGDGKYSVALENKAGHMELRTAYIGGSDEVEPLRTTTNIYQPDIHGLMPVNSFIGHTGAMTHATLYGIWEYPKRREILTEGCGNMFDLVLFVGVTGKVAEIDTIQGILFG